MPGAPITEPIQPLRWQIERAERISDAVGVVMNSKEAPFFVAGAVRGRLTIFDIFLALLLFEQASDLGTRARTLLTRLDALLFFRCGCRERFDRDCLLGDARR